MSIVEKVIDRQRKAREGRAGDAHSAERQTEPAAKVRESRDREADVVVDTLAASRAGLVSMIDNPALAQEFKFLKRPLLSELFNPSKQGDSGGHVLLVTSDLPGAGKSFVSMNLAAAIAREQLIRVVLIDGDPLRRNLTTALGMEEKPGLLELLVDADARPDDAILPTELPSLYFMLAGQQREDSTELLASKRLEEVMDDIDDPDTVIVLDSPPLLLTAEARVLVERADRTLIVVEAGRTSVNDVASVFKIVGEHRASVSIVLNKAPSSNSGRYSRYRGYGYGYEGA